MGDESPTLVRCTTTLDWRPKKTNKFNGRYTTNLDWDLPQSRTKPKKCLNSICYIQLRAFSILPGELD